MLCTIVTTKTSGAAAAAMSLEPWAAALIALGALGTVVVLARLATRAAFFDVRGRTVLITGGSSGIGKATAAVRARVRAA